MTDTASLYHLAPFARMFAATGPTLPLLLEAYRTGGGVSWEQLGPDARESQADVNRPWYDARLAADLAGVPDLHGALARPGARVADVGAGALVQHRPGPGLSRCRGHRPRHRPPVGRDGAGQRRHGRRRDRVRFHGDGADLDAASYDVAFAFECIHDMAQPVEVLSSVRRVLGARRLPGRDGRGRGGDVRTAPATSWSG